MPWTKAGNLKGPDRIRYAAAVQSAASGAFAVTFPTPLPLTTVISCDVESGAATGAYSYGQEWSRTLSADGKSVVGVSGNTLRTLKVLNILGTLTAAFGPLTVNVIALDAKTT